MGIIQLLPEELSNQIAAGEVVERPANALKELVENALDAGASRCDIEIEGGGISRLAVRDDGSGMSEEDARLSVQRHATSKLKVFSDLERLTSYGFRGEALASIASVSTLVVRTRQSSADVGTEVIVEAGGRPRIAPVGTPVGTLVEVRDLFSKVPARRKFMRSSGTESGHAIGVVEAAALGRPGITFTVSRDGRPAREWLRAQGRAERVRDLLGAEELAQLLGERGPLRVEAFLSRPERARSGSGGLRILVNDRIISDRAIAATIAQAYGSVLERGRYPRGVVYLTLPTALVDINVHPQKSEVRFADPRAVSGAVYSILSQQLSGAFGLNTAPRRAGPEPSDTWVRPKSAGGALFVRDKAEVPPPSAPAARAERAVAVAAPSPRAALAPAAVAAASDTAAPGLASASTANDATLSSEHESTPRLHSDSAPLRFVAQVRNMYLVCEGDDGLYLLDQHAAAERVTFDRLKAEYGRRQVTAQHLLFPVTVEIMPSEGSWIEEHTALLTELGFEVRRRGERMASVHTVPRLLTQGDPERLLRGVLSELCAREDRDFGETVDKVLATAACHSSLRAGDPVSAEEARALLEALARTDFSGHCPHGRLVVTRLSWAELERSVGRR